MPQFRIRDTQTGKTVTVSGSTAPTQADAERIFRDAGLRSGQTPQPPKQDLLNQIAKVVLPTGEKVATTLGTALGLRSGAQAQADQATQEALASSQRLIKKAQQTKDPKQREKLLALSRQIDQGMGEAATHSNQENIAKMPTATANPIRQGFGVGAETAAWLAPGGKTLTGQVGTGALAGGLFSASDPNASLQDVATGVAAGGALGGALGVGSKAAKWALDKSGQLIQKEGEQVVLRGLKPSKSQLTNFKTRTGKDLADWLNTQKIHGDFLNEANSRIDNLQQQFDDLAINSGAKVDKGKLQQSFIKRMAELKSSVLPSVRGKAEDLQTVLDNIIGKHGDSIDVGKLTEERRAIDRFLKDNQFGIPADQANYLRSARDALQESVQEATKGMGTKDLKQIGHELRDLYAFKKLAETQSNLGRGTNMLGLLNLLGAGSGGIIGGIPGAIAGLALPTALRNPRVISGLSKGAKITGEGLQKASKTGDRLEPLRRALRNVTLEQVSQRDRLPAPSSY